MHRSAQEDIIQLVENDHYNAVGNWFLVNVKQHKMRC